MKIEVISVSALSDGAEILVTVAISNGEGSAEKRKFLLFTEQYLELGIRKGSLIDEAIFEELEKLAKSCRAIKKGTDLLFYSSSSRVRLAQRLRSKGIDGESAENAAEHLQKLGLINEKADVERQVASCLKKLWGKKRIYRELCAKGYDSDIVSFNISLIDEKALTQNCVMLIRKKYRVLPREQNEVKKMVASLMRYGYTFSEIKKAIEIIEN